MTDSLLDILEEAKTWHFEQFPDGRFKHKQGGPTGWLK